MTVYNGQVRFLSTTLSFLVYIIIRIDDIHDWMNIIQVPQLFYSNMWTCSQINQIILFDRFVGLVLSFKFNQMIFLFFLCFDIGNIILSKENIGNITFCLIITG